MDNQKEFIVYYSQRLAMLDREHLPFDGTVQKKLKQRIKSILNQLETPSPNWQIIVRMEQALDKNLWPNFVSRRM